MIITIDADTSSPYQQRSPDHVHVVPDSEVLSTSGLALTALHCVHILVLLPTMLKHATPWLAAMSSNVIAMSADRQRRLAALLEKEKGELDADKQAMVKS